MSTIVEKIKLIEDECDGMFSFTSPVARTQKNKATSFHLGQLKAKLAKLKRELLTPSTGGGGGGGPGFDVARTGIASVGFVGFPSVGKSSLMSGLTGTESIAAAYEFTTLTTYIWLGSSAFLSDLTCLLSLFSSFHSVPGTLTVHGAPIQILDLPGIIEGAKDGKGRGRQVIAVARTCQLILICLDVLKPLGDKAIIENELEGFGIRLNKTPPNISIKKKDKGGIAITNTQPLTQISHEEIKAVLAEYRMANADVHIRCDPTVDDLVDVCEGNRIYIPALYVLNKIDAISIEELDLLYRIPNSVPISAREWLNIDELIEAMWDKLSLVRIYTKPRGAKQPDYSAPVVLKRQARTVEDFANAIHKDISKQLKYAVVWGTSVKHARGQKVGLTHVLEDEDAFLAPSASTLMTTSPALLARTFLRSTLDDIVPLTASSVTSGSKVFGAGVYKGDGTGGLEVVTVGTNTETSSPLLHGEIQTIQQFYALPREERPEAKDCVFYCTHEPCSLCLSGITWGGFRQFYYLFTYEDTRDTFSIPYDIDILQEVFRVPSTCAHESPTDLSSRPLYNKSNKFFSSSSVAELIAQVEHPEERGELERLVEEVKGVYGGLSEEYQKGKGAVGIPLA
ncbi:hypothetical protein JCM11251_001508 [Rhodosporidiobolus azoricus]